MRVFIDTNIFIASLTAEPVRGEVATELLNSEYELYTSVLNLMELRSVLLKKKHLERDKVQEMTFRIAQKTKKLAPTIRETVEAFNFQTDRWLYPMDCLMLSLANDRDLTFVTFDSELLDHGAYRPETILDSGPGV